MRVDEQLHCQLIRLNDEAAATAATLDARIEAAVGEMKAARAAGDMELSGLCKEVYINLVAREKALSVRRAALEAQLAGGQAPSLPPPHSLPRTPRPCTHEASLPAPAVALRWLMLNPELPSQFSHLVQGSSPHSPIDYSTLTPCPALPCPALPCPALPCPALPCCWVAVAVTSSTMLKAAAGAGAGVCGARD